VTLGHEGAMCCFVLRSYEGPSQMEDFKKIKGRVTQEEYREHHSSQRQQGEVRETAARRNLPRLTHGGGLSLLKMVINTIR